MTFDETSESLVILNAPPSLEEALVDWLLAHGSGTGFTSFPAEGHSTRHDNLSTAEQVSGRQRRQQFQVQMASAAVDEFLNAGDRVSLVLRFHDRLDNSEGLSLAVHEDLR